jgi:hypothetical protein
MRKIPPLNWQVPITDPKTGRPTPEFIRLFQDMFLNGEDTEDTLEEKADKDTEIIAGVGLGGGGDLSADRTINLEDTAVTPGSYTATDLTVDAQGRITAASNGSSGGASWTILDQTGNPISAGPSWTFSSPSPTINFTNLGAWSEIMLWGYGIEKSTSQTIWIRVSADNGSTFYNTSGNYTTIPDSNFPANNTAFLLGANAFQSRGFNITIPLWNAASSKPAWTHSLSVDTPFQRFTPTVALNAIQVTNPGGTNFTAGSIFLMAR